jgi:transcriptional regulator with XRE-family HTH domain
MTDVLRASIAAAVRAEIARHQKTQREVALVLGLPQPSVSKRLLGEVPFRAEEIAAIAAWLGVDPSTLLPAAEGAAA